MAAELTEAFLCSIDVVALRNLMAEIGCFQEAPTIIYQDNAPAISVAARGSVGSPPLIGSLWATANGGRHKAMRPGRGVAEWHMLPSWNSLHTLLVARAVLLWHGASYPMLRCSSLARHPDLGPPTVPCARRPLFWYPIPVRIGSPTGDAWLTCQCASQSACSAFHNIRRLSLPSLAGEGTSHCAICWLRLDTSRRPNG